MAKMVEIRRYKGWVITKSDKGYHVYSSDEWQYPKEMRICEFDCESVMECINNIDSYNKKGGDD